MHVSQTAINRFYAAIEKQPNGGCWLWTKRSVSSYGYGQLWDGDKKWEAHRMSWVIHCGDIPAGLCVCHKCDVPHCVNPVHLFVASQKGNLKDMRDKMRGHLGYRHNPPRGTANAKAKFTDHDIETIRARYAKGESLRELGRAYKVWHTTISVIIRRRAWRHIK